MQTPNHRQMSLMVSRKKPIYGRFNSCPSTLYQLLRAETEMNIMLRWLVFMLRA